MTNLFKKVRFSLQISINMKEKNTIFFFFLEFVTERPLFSVKFYFSSKNPKDPLFFVIFASLNVGYIENRGLTPVPLCMVVPLPPEQEKNIFPLFPVFSLILLFFFQVMLGLPRLWAKYSDLCSLKHPPTLYGIMEWVFQGTNIQCI